MFHTLLKLLHDATLMALAAVSISYVLILLKYRFQLRRVLFSWHPRSAFYIPRWMLWTFATSVLVWTYLTFATQDFSGWAILGYVLISKSLLISGFIANLILVTDHGILQRLGYGRQTLAWGQVEDYVIHERKTHDIFVFFYQDELGRRQRFELIVPKKIAKDLRPIAAQKLDARFNYTVQQSFGSKALND